MRSEKQLENWNFGLKARSPVKAMEFAVQERVRTGAISFATAANARPAQKMFAKFLKSEGIKDLRRVELAHLTDFAEQQKERVEAGDISWRTAIETLSRINSTMVAVRCDDKIRLTPTDAGFPKRSGITTVNHAIEMPQPGVLSDQHCAILGIERAFGTRQKEAILLDAKLALKRAEETGRFTLSNGTKGGRPRICIVDTQQKLDALRFAAELQAGSRSQIPDHMEYKEFRAAMYRSLGENGIKPHGLRHAYAHERYLQLTGCPAPVVWGVKHERQHLAMADHLGVTLQQAREIDRAARMTIALELGHGRPEITNAYLG